MNPIGLKEIRETALKIADNIVRTPCAHSKTLSDITGTHVILKFENHQFTASFKERGALAKLLSLTETEKKRGVIAASAGNHAQAVAYHAQRLGIPATIVMPRFTPNVKVENTRRFGARVILEGKVFDEAQTYAITTSHENGMTFIPPYDDERVIAGQGTIALEMLEDFPDLDALIISIGGGGLISGNAIAAKSLNPSIEVYGVQATRFPSMAQALKGKPAVCGSQTIAEGIAVKQPGRLTLPIVREYVDDIFLVEEDEIEAAVLLLLEVEKTVVEGAGAAGLAALTQQKKRFRGKKVGLILSGGNIDLIALSSIIQRGLVRSGRLVRLTVGIPDVPGALSEVTRILGNLNANIMEIRHQRAFTNLSLKLAEVEFVLQALGKRHIQEIVETLTRSGYKATLNDSNPDISD
ncbi:MAG: threonine ammonia-lyase [Deltaproteobacteria bacterium]|nr:MAG: threonine ammonia-lyase [Deltaproteobacteria bacterium]